MKVQFALLFLCPLFIFQALFFSKKSTFPDLQNHTQQEEKLLSAVPGNPDLLQKIYSAMMNMDDRGIKNDSLTMQSCMRMMDNPEMMSRMMDRMMMKCERDSAMCRVMHKKMMSSPDMMNRMMDNPEMMSKMMDGMMARCQRDSAMCRMMQSKMMNCPNMMHGKDQSMEHHKMDGKTRRKR